jgi:hypothetical protein
MRLWVVFFLLVNCFFFTEGGGRKLTCKMEPKEDAWDRTHPGERSHMSFVTIKAIRCGSSWLQEILISHTRIKSQFELPEVNLAAALKCQQCNGQPNSKHMETLLPKAVPLSACGASIFPKNDMSEVAQISLNNDRPTRWILLGRKDHFAVHVSSVVHFQKKKDNTPFKESAEQCEKGMIQAKQAYDDTMNWRHTAAINRIPVLVLIYEDVLRNPDQAIASLQAFLEVPHENLSSDVHERNAMKTHEYLVNYAELRRHFGQGPWSGFLDEDFPEK